MGEHKICGSFQSERNGEGVNATDGLFAIADAISSLLKPLIDWA